MKHSKLLLVFTVLVLTGILFTQNAIACGGMKTSEESTTEESHSE